MLNLSFSPFYNSKWEIIDRKMCNCRHILAVKCDSYNYNDNSDFIKLCQDRNYDRAL